VADRRHRPAQRARRALAPARALVLALALAPPLLGAVAAAPAWGEPLTLNGITFSDELGGFALVDGWGGGSPDDPFVLLERITSDGPAVLVIRGLSTAFGNPLGSNHFVGFALTKVVVNGTQRVWRSFSLGLQASLGEDSTYYDGLSFGQDDSAVRTLASDLYGDVVVIDEPVDGMRFRDGQVGPGEQVMFRLMITDNAPKAEFYLVQQREQHIVLGPGRGVASLVARARIRRSP